MIRPPKASASDLWHRRRLVVGIGVLATLATSCGGDDLLLPAEGAAAAIEIVRGNGQSAAVGQPLPDSLVVRVTDLNDRPVAGQRVAFVSSDPSAAASPDTGTTDADGLVASRIVLGTLSGAQTIEARVVPAATQPLSATFEISAAATTAATLTAVRGQEQSGVVEAALPEPLVVRVADQFGNPVGGISVRWAAGGGGAVSAATVTTGSDGLAAVERTLGAEPGQYTTSATVDGLSGSPVRFASIGVPGPTPKLAFLVAPPAAAPNRLPLSPAPVLQLQSALGTPLNRSGVLVTAAVAMGGGTLAGTVSSRTNATGRATFSDLRLQGPAGPHRIIFAADNYVPVTSASIELRPPDPSRSASTIVSAPATVEASTGGSASIIAVTARDAEGNPLPGLPVSVAASRSADQITLESPTTGGNGVARARFSSTAAGTATLTASVGGVTLDQRATITITPGPPNASTSDAVVPERVTPTSQVVITVRTRDEFNNPRQTGGAVVQVSVSGNGFRTSPTVRDNGDGTYTAQYLLLGFGFGTDQVTITLNGVPIRGSPYQIEVGS